MSVALEKKIASALTADVKSADIAALIAETEVAITQAAEAERAKALDPIVSPDAAKAHAAMTDAAFMRERLRTALPRLRERYQEVAAQKNTGQRGMRIVMRSRSNAMRWRRSSASSIGRPRPSSSTSSPA